MYSPEVEAIRYNIMIVNKGDTINQQESEGLANNCCLTSKSMLFILHITQKCYFRVRYTNVECLQNKIINKKYILK